MDYTNLKNDLSRNVAGLCVWQRTRNASRILSRRYDAALRGTGLNVSQYSMLVIISLSEERTLTDLAARMGLERTTLIRNIKPLERDGMIKQSDEGYRRARSVEITDKGLAKLEEILPRWHDVQNKLKAELGTEMWTNMHQSLKAMNALE